MPFREKDFETLSQAGRDGDSVTAKGLGLQHFHQPAADAGLSLDDLNAAFAGMLSGGQDPYSESGPAVDELDPVGDLAAGVSTESDGDAHCEVTPLTILEAMLFVGSASNESLTSERVSSMMRGVRPAEIDDFVRDLNERYEADGRPYRIEHRGDGYRMTLREPFLPIVDRFYDRNRQAKLSPAAIEVLSLIAYNGPQTADELARLRGRPSGAVLSQLVRRQLLRVERDPENRRLTRYHTTPRFLTLLGISSLEDLPRSHDIERR
jgi:segregation and condensation protein B